MAQTMPTKEVDIYIDTFTTFIKEFPVTDSNLHVYAGEIYKHIDSCEPVVEFLIQPNGTVVDTGMIWDRIRVTLNEYQTTLMKPDRSYIYTIVKRNVNTDVGSVVASGNVLVSMGTRAPIAPPQI
jgi:hypothetical protein